MQRVFEKIVKHLEIRSTENRAEGTTYGEVAADAIDMCVDVIKLFVKEYNNGWIPCSKRLPEEPAGEKELTADDVEEMILHDKLTEYNVTINGAAAATTLYYAGNGDWYDGMSQEWYSVIAWQPLPESYKEDSER